MKSAAFAHDAEPAHSCLARARPGALRVGPARDAIEAEADRMADEAAPPAWSLSRMTIDPPRARDGESESAPTSFDIAPPVVHDALRGAGKPLDRKTRGFMEARFRHDFGSVRILDDDTAARSARAVAARAYTAGEKIVFDRGQYAPASGSGRRLLAHELAHVLQQTGRTASGPAPGLLRRQAVPAPAKAATPAPKPVSLADQLRKVIQEAQWREKIRARRYPVESAAGIRRAKGRKAGRLTDLTGVGSLISIERFAMHMHALPKTWGPKTPDERLAAVTNLANAELSDAKVPEFRLPSKSKPMLAKAEFSSLTWQLFTSDDIVTKSALSNDDAADLANSALHESRHAEQQYLAARYAAGILHQDETTIATTQQIDADVAKEAVKNKFTVVTDLAVAELGARMYQAYGVERSSNQKLDHAVDLNIGRLDAMRRNAEVALAALKANSTPATVASAKAARDTLQAQIRNLETSYTAYRNIPYEADAHEVGDAEEEAYKGWK
ncbi:DUF4157 domain-containing protein [Paraburkholderia sp. SIMBA_049]